MREICWTRHCCWLEPFGIPTVAYLPLIFTKKSRYYTQQLSLAFWFSDIPECRRVVQSEQDSLVEARILSAQSIWENSRTNLKNSLAELYLKKHRKIPRRFDLNRYSLFLSYSPTSDNLAKKFSVSWSGCPFGICPRDRPTWKMEHCVPASTPLSSFPWKTTGVRSPGCRGSSWTETLAANQRWQNRLSNFLFYAFQISNIDIVSCRALSATNSPRVSWRGAVGLFRGGGVLPAAATPCISLRDRRREQHSRLPWPQKKTLSLLLSQSVIR